MRRAFGLFVVGAMLAWPAAAVASTHEINNWGLVGSDRGWDPYNGETNGYLSGTGFSPVDDGTLLQPGRFADDAFDGGLMLGVDGTAFLDGDNQGTASSKTNSFTVGPNFVGSSSLSVSETERAAGPYLRVLVKLSNPTSTAYSGTIKSASDLGSDGAESTQASSSGDKSFTLTDSWVVSSETGANGAGDDPTDTLVFWGKGAKNKVTTLEAGPGSGNVVVDFNNLTVPAGATRYLLFYAELSRDPKVAKASAQKYSDPQLSSSLLKYIPKSTQKKILNWDLG